VAVLDLLREAALRAAGEAPDQRDGRRSIKAKVRKAKASAARPKALSPLARHALTSTHAETENFWHGLVAAAR
jgi:hypothetical protein